MLGRRYNILLMTIINKLERQGAEFSGYNQHDAQANEDEDAMKVTEDIGPSVKASTVSLMESAIDALSRELNSSDVLICLGASLQGSHISSLSQNISAPESNDSLNHANSVHHRTIDDTEDDSSPSSSLLTEELDLKLDDSVNMKHTSEEAEIHINLEQSDLHDTCGPVPNEEIEFEKVETSAKSQMKGMQIPWRLLREFDRPLCRGIDF